MMDFPGAGLLEAIIAKNMKNAISSAVAHDFAHVWKNICYSATGKPYNGRVEQLKSYLNGIFPSENWGVIVSREEWGADIVYDPFFVTSKSIDGYNHLVFRRNDPSSLPSNFAETVLDLVNGITGSAQERAESIATSVRTQFPEYKWNLFVKKAPGGFSNWAFDLGGTYYKAWIDGYAYLFWTENL
jgi:1-phosphatidylinositol phosphodiesterase